MCYYGVGNNKQKECVQKVNLQIIRLNNISAANGEKSPGECKKETNVVIGTKI